MDRHLQPHDPGMSETKETVTNIFEEWKPTPGTLTDEVKEVLLRFFVGQRTWNLTDDEGAVSRRDLLMVCDALRQYTGADTFVVPRIKGMVPDGLLADVVMVVRGDDVVSASLCIPFTAHPQFFLGTSPPIGPVMRRFFDDLFAAWVIGQVDSYAAATTALPRERLTEMLLESKPDVGAAFKDIFDQIDAARREESGEPPHDPEHAKEHT